MSPRVSYSGTSSPARLSVTASEVGLSPKKEDGEEGEEQGPQGAAKGAERLGTNDTDIEAQKAGQEGDGVQEEDSEMDDDGLPKDTEDMKVRLVPYQAKVGDRRYDDLLQGKWAVAELVRESPIQDHEAGVASLMKRAVIRRVKEESVVDDWMIVGDTFVNGSRICRIVEEMGLTGPGRKAVRTEDLGPSYRHRNLPAEALAAGASDESEPMGTEGDVKEEKEEVELSGWQFLEQEKEVGKKETKIGPMRGNGVAQCRVCKNEVYTGEMIAMTGKGPEDVMHEGCFEKMLRGPGRGGDHGGRGEGGRGGRDDLCGRGE